MPTKAKTQKIKFRKTKLDILLRKLGACEVAKAYYQGLTLTEAWRKPHKGHPSWKPWFRESCSVSESLTNACQCSNCISIRIKMRSRLTKLFGPSVGVWKHGSPIPAWVKDNWDGYAK